jgi:hypothetical protein
VRERERQAGSLRTPLKWRSNESQSDAFNELNAIPSIHIYGIVSPFPFNKKAAPESIPMDHIPAQEGAAHIPAPQVHAESESSLLSSHPEAAATTNTTGTVYQFGAVQVQLPGRAGPITICQACVALRADAMTVGSEAYCEDCRARRQAAIISGVGGK